MADRDTVINNLSECIEHIREKEFAKIPFWGNCQLAMMDAIELLKEHDTELLIRYEEGFINAQPVRCRDCKYWERIIGNMDGHGWCNAGNRIIVSAPDWYCADGKSKT